MSDLKIIMDQLVKMERKLDAFAESHGLMFVTGRDGVVVCQPSVTIETCYTPKTPIGHPETT